MVSYWHFVKFLWEQLLCLNPYCNGRSSRSGNSFTLWMKLHHCLNPCCSGQWSRTSSRWKSYSHRRGVLILVVVDNGLVRLHHSCIHWKKQGLNPCCNGQWSRTTAKKKLSMTEHTVLILVVMEDGLVRRRLRPSKRRFLVVILVVMEDGLALDLIRHYWLSIS